MWLRSVILASCISELQHVSLIVLAAAQQQLGQVAAKVTDLGAAAGAVERRDK